MWNRLEKAFLLGYMMPYMHLTLLSIQAGKCGLNLATIRSLRDSCPRLRIRLKLPPDKGMSLIPRRQLIRVKKRARQGAVISPDLFNNYVQKA